MKDPIQRQLMRFLTAAILTASCLIISSSIGRAHNLAVVFGGGCDGIKSKSDHPFFDEMTSMAKGLQRHGWEVMAYYGGIEPLEEFSEKAGLASTDVANQANLIKSLEYAVNHLQAGDQFLLLLHAHGTEQIRGLPHAICTATSSDGEEYSKQAMARFGELYNQTHDLTMLERKAKIEQASDEFMRNMLKNAIYTSIDEPAIKGRIKALKRRGVRVSIIDGSCYSGATAGAYQNLACVVTAGNVHHPTPSGAIGPMFRLTSLLNPSVEPSSPLSMHDFFATSAILSSGDKGSGTDDPQSSAFLEWTALPASSRKVESDQALERECFLVATKTFRAMGVPETSIPKILEDPAELKHLDLAKCTSYLRHVQKVSVSGSVRQKMRLSACSGFKLIR